MMSPLPVGVLLDAGEVGRVLDVGGLVVPGVGVALRGGDGLPVGVALEHVGVAAREHLARDVLGDEVLDLLVRWARCP